MPSKSKNSPNEPSQRVKILIALLRNSQELALHQLLQDAEDVLHAANRIASSFAIELDGELERMAEKIKSKPWRELAIDFDLLIENIVRNDRRKSK